MSIIERAVERLREAKQTDADAATPQPAAVDNAGSAPLNGVEASVLQERPKVGPPSGPYQEIAFHKLRRKGMICPEDGNSGVAEEFRLIKRPLLQNAFSKAQAGLRHRNLIMVTSAMPKEGKTFCSVNLAMSIAMELDRTVLLVDADVRRPSIMSSLGMQAGRGLIDVLRSDDVKLSDVIVRTNIDNLRVLPAGAGYHRATELLASEMMRDLLDEMANRYSDRVIIFDSPPLLATSEASALAMHMGQILLVVQAERTPQAAVLRATEQLVDCPIVLPLLNSVEALPGMAYNQGYYGLYASK
jgi:protein-tyrosine kinase